MAAEAAAPSKKQRQEEVYANLHLGMDHVLTEMMKHSPPAHAEPLPSALKLKTENQPLATTWAHLTSSFEKRKAMLQRRREKAERRKHRGQSASPRSDNGHSSHREKPKAGRPVAKPDNSPRDEPPKQRKKSGPKPKNKQKSAPMSSPRGRSFPAPKSPKSKAKNGHSASSDYGEPAYPTVAPPDPHSELILRRLRAQPGLEELEFDSKKYKALFKWLETDKGKDNPISPLLVAEAKRLRPVKTPNKPSDSLRKALQKTTRTKQTTKRRRTSVASGRKYTSRTLDEDAIVYESGEEEEEPEYDGGYSDSGDDEAEFVLEPLSSSPPPPEKSKMSKKRGRPTNAERLRRQKEERQNNLDEMSAKQQLAAVMAKLKADNMEPGAVNPMYLSYGQPPQQQTQTSTKVTSSASSYGSSAQAAIVLDESEDEDESADDKAETKQEEVVHATGSSTDDDEDLFDLDEEDVYVVESILRVKEGRALLTAGGTRRTKEADLYLVKWDGYDELTWEPEENIPNRLIELFRERERAKRACQYQIKEYGERKVVTNVTTGDKEIIYSIQWSNQPQLVWEARSTLPDKTATWMEKVLGGRPPASKKRVKVKAAKQFFYQ